MKTKLGVLAFFVLLVTNHAVSQSVNNYYLPQVANGTYNGGSFRTSFVFFNNTSSSATVIMSLTNDSGSSFSVTIPGLGTSNQFTFQLAAGASRTLQTDGTGPLTVGAAQILSTAAIGVSGIFTIYDDQGGFLTESGVGNSSPLTDFVIPVQNGGNYSTGLALYNPNATASYTAILLDTNGAELARTTKSLASGAHSAFFVTGSGQLFPSVGDVQGTLVIQSTVAISAVVLRQSSTPFGFTSLPVVSKSSVKTSLNLAQVANGSNGGGSFRTSFMLFSIASSTANVTMELTKDDGSPLSVTIPGRGTGSSFSFALQNGKSLFLQTDGNGSLSTGAARITSDVPIGATSIFTVYDVGGNFQTEAGVGDSPALTQFTLPADLTGNFDTGVAFFNPNASSVTVTLRFMNTNGENNGLTPQVTLPAKGHSAAFVSQFFPGLGSVQGTVAISSTSAIAAVTLRQNSDPFGFTTLPVVSGTAPGTTATKTLLSQTQTGVSATSNTTVDKTLPSGFKLSGTISGGTGSIVTAQSGSNLYYGIVLSGKYVVVLPAGTYTVKVLFSPVSQTTSIMSYSRPGQVPVSADTTLDIAVPVPTLFAISGTVSNMAGIPSSAVPELVLTTNDNSIESLIPITNGAYQGSVPAGSYVVSLQALALASGASSEEMNAYNIGTVTVSGITTANFAAPNLVTLNGSFNTVTPWASLGGDVEATDTSGPAIDPFAYLAPPRTSAVPFLKTALSYQLLLAQNRTYGVRLIHSISGSNPTVALGSIYLPITVSTVNMSGNNSYNFTVPALPGQVTISGHVTDGTGTAVAHVSVTASTESITGASNTGFAANGTTDSSGNYSFNVLSGTNYQLIFTPPSPTP